jgi:hypothetical protein
VSRRAREEEIRAKLEAAFQAHDESMTRAGRPYAKANVDRVELRGSYPDTCLIIFGKNNAGEAIETEYPMWAYESFSWDQDEGIGLLITSYTGG